MTCKQKETYGEACNIPCGKCVACPCHVCNELTGYICPYHAVSEFMGMKVVVDPNMPPDSFKIVKGTSKLVEALEHAANNFRRFKSGEITPTESNLDIAAHTCEVALKESVSIQPAAFVSYEEMCGIILFKMKREGVSYRKLQELTGVDHATSQRALKKKKPMDTYGFLRMCEWAGYGLLPK